MKEKDKKFNHSLGELEAEIMEVVWKLKKCPVRLVLDKLRSKRKVAYTTVMTVMARLHDKGLLKRTLDASGAYVYSSVRDKKEFLVSASKNAINNLIKEFGDVAVAQFIDIMESGDTKKLKEWRQKLKKM